MVEENENEEEDEDVVINLELAAEEKIDEHVHEPIGPTTEENEQPQISELLGVILPEDIVRR